MVLLSPHSLVVVNQIHELRRQSEGGQMGVYQWLPIPRIFEEIKQRRWRGWSIHQEMGCLVWLGSQANLDFVITYAVWLGGDSHLFEAQTSHLWNGQQ